LDRNGTFIRQLGSGRTDVGQITGPWGVANFGGAGRVIVTLEMILEGFDVKGESLVVEIGIGDIVLEGIGGGSCEARRSVVRGAHQGRAEVVG
jgi:hypothetical protein